MFLPKHLYTVKDYYWLVFPDKESAGSGGSTARACLGLREAEYWSKELGCLATFIEPNSNFIVLEVDGDYVKILGSKLGWISVKQIPWMLDSFEEIEGKE